MVAVSLAYRVFYESSAEQLRTILPGHNSLAWIIWHIARGEDWGVNAMFRGEEQVLTRDGWIHRLGVPRQDFGNGMTEDEVTDLTRRIDLDALRGYFDAVTAESRRFFETLDFDRIDDPLDVQARQRPVPSVHARWQCGPGGCRTDGEWALIDAMALSDVMMHVSEAQHVSRNWPRNAWG